MLKIPDYFFKVTYKGAHYPGAAGLEGLKGGANCQVFAYEILRHFGQEVPDFRSSDLWEDQTYTQEVKELEPLDLLLWNNSEEAWGAHVGLYLGDNQAIHLSKPIGKPVIWPLEEFLTKPEYTFFIGAKRLVSKSNN